MKRNVRRVWTSAKAFVITAVMALGFAQVATAQDRDASVEVNKNFTVCPLNVDGLPEKILGITVNSDGKGEAGAAAIGEYLKAKGIDVVALSEDFNYHDALVNALGDGFVVGNYRGGISSDNYESNVRFNTDGLEFITKQPTTFSNESWTEWSKNNGKFTNGSDELIRKGFRYYTVDLGDGVLVDFYIMHMDADDKAEDNAARASQWEQLCNAIKTRNSGRPVIVMGDTNSRYTRDDILGKFTTPLSSDYDIKDAWVTLCRGDKYPVAADNENDALVIPADKKLDSEAYKNYEIVDKVIYLNPKDATYKLTANTIDFDAANYQKDGALLGDHVPVIVNFTAAGNVVTKFEPATANSWWRGEDIVGNDQKAYIFNLGAQRFLATSDASKLVVDDINSADIWNIRTSNTGDHPYTIDTDSKRDAKDGYRINLDFKVFSWSAELKKGSGATDLAITESDTEDGKAYHAYKFSSVQGLSKQMRYFGVDKGNDYSFNAAENSDGCNDWLLISETQKETYTTYKNLYAEAKGYEAMDGLSDDLKNELDNVLNSTAESNYNTSADDIKSLEDIIEKIKNWFYRDVKITAAKYGTICLPWNAKVPEGVTVYYATKYNAATTPNFVHLEKYEGDVIPGNTGFLVWSDVDATTTYRFYYSPESATLPEGNILSGTVNGIKHEDLSFDKYNYMLLGNKSKGVGFYRLDETSYISACRAYIQLSTTSDGSGSSTKPADTFASFDLGGSTAVTGIQSSANAKAVAVYGIAGEKRSAMQRGVNIVKMSDGTVKKVMVK